MPILVARARADNWCQPITHAHIDISGWLQSIIANVNTQKCIAGCKLPANIRERRHLQPPAVLEDEKLQRRQSADRLGQRLQPLLMNPKILNPTSREREREREREIPRKKY